MSRNENNAFEVSKERWFRKKRSGAIALICVQRTRSKEMQLLFGIHEDHGYPEANIPSSCPIQALLLLPDGHALRQNQTS